MELEELPRRIAIEARQIQAELRQIKNDSYSNQSIESTISRIEDRLIKVHNNTDTLIERVPTNLKPLLLEVKATILDRIDSLKEKTTELSGSTELSQVTNDANWLKNTFNKLTSQEKRLFQICFQTGLITYRELAQKLDITPTSAKNLVNRLFKNPGKCKLFEKRNLHGISQIRVAKNIEKHILNGKVKHRSKVMTL